MPRYIDPETINVDDLPGIWSPVQWELSESERVQELNTQATASLLWAVDAPEAILRLLLGETAIDRAMEAPKGYNSELQGEWDASLVTFQFKRQIELLDVVREGDYLYVEYRLEDLGVYALEIEPDNINISRL